MKLTTRGRMTVLVVAVTMLLAWRFGARALNAIAAPLVVALVVGVVHLHRSNSPTLEMTEPAPGFPGEQRTLWASLEGSGLVTVIIPETDGLVGGAIDATVTVPHTIEHSVKLQDRGVYDIAPETIRQQGPLGLVVRDIPVETETTLVVYPRQYPLTSASPLVSQFTSAPVTERQEFDHLREYVAGDPLRNVHWKSSAKRDEFMVMEFSSSRPDETVTIAASTGPGYTDEMASAAATVVEAALEGGVAVGLVVPDETVEVGHGTDHRRRLLTALARTGSGRFPDSVARDADVFIQSGRQGTEIWAGEERFTLEELLGETAETEAVVA